MDTREPMTRVNLVFEGGYRFKATYPDLPGAPELDLDEPPPLGDGRGPNPAALLATALGNCLASSLLFCARKARVPIDAIRVTADARIGRNAAGRLRLQQVDVVLTPALSAADNDRLERCRQIFEDFCIVTAAVREGIDVNVTVTPELAETPMEAMS